MGMPVKLSDDLVRAARDEAATASRSITAQIEHWARLGRAAESILPHRDVQALKADLENAVAAGAVLKPETEERIRALLYRVARWEDRSSVLAELQAGSRVLYESDPDDPNLVVRVAAGGERTRGRFEGKRFEPVSPHKAARKPA